MHASVIIYKSVCVTPRDNEKIACGRLFIYKQKAPIAIVSSACVIVGLRVVGRTVSNFGVESSRQMTDKERAHNARLAGFGGGRLSWFALIVTIWNQEI